MKDLSPEAQRLVHLARGADDPDEPTLARVERGLATRLALGAGAAGTTTALAASAAGAGTPLAVKALITLGVTAGLASGAWLGAEQLHLAPTPSAVATRRALPVRPATESPSRPERTVPSPPPLLAPSGAPEGPAAAPGPETTAAPSDRTSGAVPSAPGVDRSRAASHAGPALESAPADDPLHAEATALRAAQRALRGGDARRALALLDEQDARFQGGSLEEERAAARVLALCQAYGRDGVHGAADRFEQRFPRSALLARVRSACRDRSVPATKESIPRK